MFFYVYKLAELVKAGIECDKLCEGHFWIKKQPYVVLRAMLLFKVPGKQIPLIENVSDHFGAEGGNLIVFPTLLHENYLLRLAALPI